MEKTIAQLVKLVLCVSAVMFMEEFGVKGTRILVKHSIVRFVKEMGAVDF